MKGCRAQAVLNKAGPSWSTSRIDGVSILVMA